MGLGGVWAHRRNQKPTIKCQRCGLRYPHDDDKCIHCGHLDDDGLKVLLDKLHKQAQSNKRLGFILLSLSLLLLIGMLAITY